ACTALSPYTTPFRSAPVGAVTLKGDAETVRVSPDAAGSGQRSAADRAALDLADDDRQRQHAEADAHHDDPGHGVEAAAEGDGQRSEEHTSELQSREN